MERDVEMYKTMKLTLEIFRHQNLDSEVNLWMQELNERTHLAETCSVARLLRAVGGVIVGHVLLRRRVVRVGVGVVSRARDLRRVRVVGGQRGRGIRHALVVL